MSQWKRKFVNSDNRKQGRGNKGKALPIERRCLYGNNQFAMAIERKRARQRAGRGLSQRIRGSTIYPEHGFRVFHEPHRPNCSRLVENGRRRGCVGSRPNVRMPLGFSPRGDPGFSRISSSSPNTSPWPHGLVMAISSCFTQFRHRDEHHSVTAA